MDLRQIGSFIFKPPPPKPVGERPAESSEDLKPLEELTANSDADLRKLTEELMAGTGASIRSLRGSDRVLDRADALLRGGEAELRKGSTPPPVIQAEPVAPEEMVLKLITADHPAVQQCIAQLKAGDVAGFNASRPAGRIDLRGIDLANVNLKGVDFRHADLTRAILAGADLTEAKFQHAIVDRADLSDAFLAKSEFFMASLRYADLRRVKTAVGAEFNWAKMNGAELNQGNFSGANFTDTSLITACLEKALFVGAQLERAHLGGAVLTEANFQRANLHRAKLFQANGEDVNFRGANLTGAVAVQAFFKNSGRTGADGQPMATSFEGAWVRGFQRGDSIPHELLKGAVADQLPPEGLFPVSPEPSNEKILVDGIEGTDKVLYDAAMEDLNELVGLKSVKKYIKDLMSVLKASQSRTQFGLPELDYILHRAYTGSPGTGKTTVARILSKLLFSLGCIDKGHLVETDKSGLVAGYQGQTPGKVNDLVNSSLGGTLLIDEAYALTNSDNDSYSQDAIAVLTKRLEDDRDKFCCLVCGYTEPMRKFMRSNPGLSERFDEFVEFPDYTSGEMVDIVKLKLDKKRFNYNAELLAEISVMLAAAKAVKEADGLPFANGRVAQRATEKMGMMHASRLENEGKLSDRTQLVSPEVRDLPFENEKMAGHPRTLFPSISELRWVGAGGTELAAKDLPTDGEFPCLTEASLKSILSAAKVVLKK